MNLKIEGWECCGLRCPDVSVSLNNVDCVSNIALILMPTGTGKTTMLQLIQATLSGSARNWDSGKVKNFQRVEDKNESGYFILKMLKGDQRLSIRLDLDFVSGKATYETTFSESGGIRHRYAPPQDVARVLEEDFVNLFVFDGEFAEDILNVNKTKAHTVIETLCELNLLNQLSELADEIWLTTSEQSTTSITHTKGLQRKRNELTKLKAREVELEKELNSRRSSLKRLQNEFKLLEDKIESKIADNRRTRDQYFEAKGNLNELDNEITNKSATLMERLRKPYEVHPFFAQELRTLHESLDRLKLPENASAQFFIELIEEAESCICGRLLDEASKSEISQRAALYLDKEEVGTLNKIKRDVVQLVEPANDDISVEQYPVLADAVANLTDAVTNRRLTKNRFSDLARQLVEAGDEELESWQATRDAFQLQINEHEKAIYRIEDVGNENETIQSTKSLSLIRRKKDEIEEEVSVIANILELRDKKDLFTQILKRARAIATDTIKTDLIQSCNSNLADILENDPLRISDIGDAIELVDQTAASVGQTLSIGYTFLASVLKRGQIKLPLVVDSPAGPLSLDVRTKVGKLLPKFCDQFIAFILDSEIDGFVHALTQDQKDVRFLTIVRKTNKTLDLIPSLQGLPNQVLKETDNAILVSDRDYFFNFKLNSDEN